MGKRLIILLISLILGLNSYAQEVPTRAQLDEETYRLYLNQEWKSVIKRGDYALNLGHDYYYLRMRLAMAWYSLGRYEKARHELLKAMVFVPNDPSALYYLYYSNLYSGRYGEARRTLEKISLTNREKMKVRGAYSVQGIFAEAGVFTNNSMNELAAGMPTGDFVSSYFVREMNYATLSAGMNLGYRSGLTLAVNRLKAQTEQYVYTGGAMQDFQHSSAQTGVYLKYQYDFSNSWYAGAAYHGMQGDYGVSYYTANNSGKYSFSDVSETYQQSFKGAYFGKHFATLDVNLHFSQNDFWQGMYHQVGASLVYYPLGSLDYYLNIVYDQLLPQESIKEKEEAWQMLAGAKLFKGFYVEGSYLFGNLSNWAGSSGYYLFNSVYPIRSRTGLNFVFSGLIPKLTFNLSGYLQERDHYANVYLPDGSISPVLQNIKTTSIFGGITWNF